VKGSQSPRIERATLELLGKRLSTQSICPSEIARLLAQPPEDWRDLMPDIRQVASQLALQDRVRITRGKTILEPRDMENGPIRLRRGPKF
jgi:Protein of unknown function (DUF3253)